MAKKCNSCGGGLESIALGKYRCPYCGSEYTEGDLTSERSTDDLETFSLLQKAREAIELEYDFKTSLKFSQSVLEKNPASQEANWLAMLAENQIAYISNDEGKYTPTFLAPETGSLSLSSHYRAFNEDYKRNADEIEKMRVATVAEMNKLKPYDVFISYRQHGQDGSETKESKWAWDLYTELKSDPRTRDLHIFFDQKSLSESNAGWEPHIFSALRSAKCMVLLGSSLENINSRWVKNEWKRFLAYKKRGEKKEIVVLGGDAVNPLLLDEGLQEKQMISNTAGRWMENILDRVAQACVKKKPAKAAAPKPASEPESEPSPAPAPKPAPAYTPPKRSSSSSSGEGINLKKILIIGFCVLLGLSIFIAIFGPMIADCNGGDANNGDNVGSDDGEKPAVSTTYQGLKLGETAGGYAIVGNDGTLSGSVELPAEHDGKKITTIMDGAFDGCASVTSLSVPDSVVEIDAGAFEGLTKLANLTVPFVGKTASAEKFEAVLGFPFGYETVADTEQKEGVGDNQDFIDEEPALTQMIGTKTAQYVGMTQVGAFYDVGHVSTFYFYAIPSTLKTVTVTKQNVVPLAAFRNMEFLEKVTFDENIITFNGYAFQHCKALNAFNSDEDKTVDASGLYRLLGENAFDGCAKIEHVVFSQSILGIGAYAFRGMNKMTQFSVPDNVTEIGVGAIEGCDALQSVTLPFVGKSASAERYEAVFGYIFGYETVTDTASKDGVGDNQDFVDETPTLEQLIGTKTAQYAGMARAGLMGTEHVTTFYFYGVPASLTTITVTKQTTIPTAAFRNLEHVTTVNYKQTVTQTGTAAFNGCGAEEYTKVS